MFELSLELGAWSLELLPSPSPRHQPHRFTPRPLPGAADGGYAEAVLPPAHQAFDGRFRLRARF